jgi:dTDP-4-dehydrorhamnose reductase
MSGGGSRYDLLTGRVDDGHPMWKYIGVDSDAIALLELLATDPCPPDVIGINYYVTSDRHLDHRLELYPDLQAGGNGIDAYVDVEAVRVPESRIAGHRAILQEAWNRYRIPVAFTEVHLACSREQQVQWLLAAWDGARAARTSGCDVRAVTAWALMGSFGWDKLLTERPFAYESGAFDTRSGSPRRTAVASVIEDLARRGRTTHVTAIAEPWWNTSVATTPVGSGIALPPSSLTRGALILGGTGTLGTAFQRICQSRGVPFRALSRSELDISDRAAVASAIEGIRPTMVINAAGYVRVNDAERDERGCNLANVRGPSVLARECALRRIPLVTFSSDLVFDGRKSSPYVESDYTGPLNVYGASKAAGEKEVLESHPSALVVRTSAFFGPWDEFNFATVALRRLLDGMPAIVPSDGIVSPTYIPDLVNASLDMVMDGEHGVWHLANEGEISWHEFARALARRAGLGEDFLSVAAAATPEDEANYPAYSALASERGAVMPTFENALDRYFNDVSNRISTTIPT